MTYEKPTIEAQRDLEGSLGFRGTRRPNDLPTDLLD